MLYRAHNAMSFSKRRDIKLLQVLELEIKKNDAGDVMGQEFLDDATFEASILHPFGDLTGRPATYLTFVKLCNCAIEGAERPGLWSFWSAKRHRLHQRLNDRRCCEREIEICRAVGGQGTVRRDAEQVWSRWALYWLLVEVEFEAAEATRVRGMDLVRRRDSC